MQEREIYYTGNRGAAQNVNSPAYNGRINDRHKIYLNKLFRMIASQKIKNFETVSHEVDLSGSIHFEVRMNVYSKFFSDTDPVALTQQLMNSGIFHYCNICRSEQDITMMLFDFSV